MYLITFKIKNDNYVLVCFKNKYTTQILFCGGEIMFNVDTISLGVNLNEICYKSLALYFNSIKPLTI